MSSFLRAERDRSRPARRHLQWQLVLGRSLKLLGTVMPGFVVVQVERQGWVPGATPPSSGEADCVVSKKKRCSPGPGPCFAGELGRLVVRLSQRWGVCFPTHPRNSADPSTRGLSSCGGSLSASSLTWRCSEFKAHKGTTLEKTILLRGAEEVPQNKLTLQRRNYMVPPPSWVQKNYDILRKKMARASTLCRNPMAKV